MKNKPALFTAVFIMSMILIPFINVFADMPAVVDEAGYLNAEENKEITERLDNIRYQYDIDVAIVIEDRMSGRTSQETADDIYDYRGYGLGSGSDGMLLYVSKTPRKYHFTTYGRGIEVFNDDALKYIESNVVPYMSNNDYYGAFTEYADTAEEVLKMASEGKTFRRKSLEDLLIFAAVIIAAPLAAASFMTHNKDKAMNTARTKLEADNYIKNGSMKLVGSRDIYLHSVQTRTPKPKNNSSTTHVSSSGRVHGGRGGSY